MKFGAGDRRIAMLNCSSTLVLIGILCAGCAPTASQSPVAISGSAEARADIAEGHLILRRYGLGSEYEDPATQQLRERLGIEVVSIAGCVIDGSDAVECEDYNCVMRAEIQRRFGIGVLERLSQTIDTTSPTSQPID